MRKRSPAHLTPRGAHRDGACARAATAATLVQQAAAQQKISQALAKYQGMPKGDDHYEVCNNFQPPNACKFVQGKISPKGWCHLFSPKT